MNRRITVLGLGTVLTIAGLAGCTQAGVPSSTGTPATSPSTVASGHPAAGAPTDADTGSNGTSTAGGAGNGTASGSDAGSGNGDPRSTPATSGPQPASGPPQAPNYGRAPVAPHPLRIPPAPAPANLTITAVKFFKFAANSNDCLFSFTLSNAGPGAASKLTVSLSLTEYTVVGQPTDIYSPLPGPTSLAGGSSHQYQLDNRSWFPGRYGATITATAANGSTSWQGLVVC